MKLAIICTHPIQYYVPVFRLLAQSVELRVFYTKGKRSNFDKGFNQGVDWDIPLKDGYLFDFFMGIKIADAIDCISKFAPDGILVYGWSSFIHLRILRYFKRKIPVLFRGDSTLLNRQSIFKGAIKYLVLKYVYRHIDKALYVGTHNKVYFKKYGLKEEQLFFAPHAIDNERFSEQTPPVIRTVLGLQQHNILILFAGKLAPVKNPELLLQAFMSIDLPDVHLLFAGSGILETKLKLAASNFENIHFMPFQNQSAMPAVYQACDIFCLPSRSDSWGLAINEAMAAGKAVLVSDKAGAAADLVHFDNGRIFRSEDEVDLKEKLSELVSDRDRLYLMGKSSGRIIASWNFKNQVKNILNALTN